MADLMHCSMFFYMQTFVGILYNKNDAEGMTNSQRVA